MDHNEKLTELALRVLISCRNELCIRYPYLNPAFGALEPEACERVQGLGTDGEKVFFEPISLLQEYVKNPEKVRHTFLHLLIHCLFLHPFDQKENRELWDFSCDTVVEQIIEKKEDLPEYAAQRIYGEQRKPALNWRQKLYFDDHIMWNTCRGKGSRLRKKWESIRVTTIRGKEKNTHYAGTNKGTREEELQELYRSRYDYRKFLKRFVFPREEVELDTESFDYIFYSYGMEHYGNIPLIEPLEYKEVNRLEELVIAIDTSGSCSREMVQTFLGETYRILSTRKNFFNKMKVYILQCDCCIQNVTVIHSEEEWKECCKEIKIEGRGGTDFRPVFRFVKEQQEKKELKNLKALIYFTDGDGIYPGAKPDYETAFVFLKKTEAMRQVPVWALRLVTGEKEERIISPAERE